MPTNIDLSELDNTLGFIIQGDAAGDEAGTSVSSAGDVNGDGIDDVIVGAPFGGDGGDGAGEAYVIYGTTGPRGTLDLTDLEAADGFIIQGDAAGDYAGRAVSSAGDVNGDGIDDIIVGAFGGDDGGSAAGEAYVIYGTTGPRGTLDLTDLEAAEGFIIQGDAAYDSAGVSVSSAGDVNGDGIDDIIVGAPFGDDGDRNAGEAYVIYGTTGNDRGTVDLTDLSSADGFIIEADAAYDRAGTSVSSAGDVNGDGIDDIIVGANLGDDGGSAAGEAYVIYGTTGPRGTLDPTDLDTADGFIIQGDTANDRAGSSVSSAGDVNDDGIDDLIVGAPFGDDGGTLAGEAYVIYGAVTTDGQTFVDDGAANTVTGDAGSDVIAGIAGNDTLDGGLGHDLIIGGFDSDTLIGGIGDDIIVGDNNALIAGADTLTGGIGDDLLEGGGGADTFIFTPQSGDDTIGQIDIDFDTPQNSTVIGADFVNGVDLIRLNGFDIDTGAEALAAMSDVNGVATFSSEGTTITFAGLTTAEFSADDFTLLDFTIL